MLAISGISLFIIGILFKIMNWPGYDIILIFSLGLLIPIYFLVTMISEFKSGDNKLFSVLFFVSIFLIVNGGLFKLMYWPGSDSLLIFGICSSALFHLTKGFIKINEGISNLVHGLSFCFLLFGILFVLMHWPGYLVMEIIAFLAAIVVIILNLQAISKGESKINLNNSKGFAVLSVIIGFLILNSISFIRLSSTFNLIYSFDELQNKNETEVAIGNSLRKNNQTEISSKIDSETGTMISILDEIKLEILRFTNSNQLSVVVESNEINPLIPLNLKIMEVENKFDQDIPLMELIGSDIKKVDSSKKGIKLWNAYNNYRNKLVELLGTYNDDENKFTLKVKSINNFDSSESLEKQIQTMMMNGGNNLNKDDLDILVNIYKLMTKKEFDYYQDVNEVHWLSRTFYHTTVIDALRILTQLQNEILNARTLALSHLSNRKLKSK